MPAPKGSDRAESGHPARLAMIVMAALAAGWLLPAPAGLQGGDFQLLVLFASTILAIIWHPYPISVVVLLSLGMGSLTGVLTLKEALSGYSNSVTWIIVSAFMFARSLIKTGLGRRIALVFIHRLGGSSLRLGYALALSDLVLSPVTASNTARTGAIIFPIARSLALEFDSRPGPTARRIGSYLLFTAYQADIITSAMFLTAMAANGLSVEFAREAGIQISWGLWFVAASLPGVLSLVAVPYLIHRAYPPLLQRTPEAREYARRELEKLGAASGQERGLLVIFTALALTWATSLWHGIPTVAAALTALCALLVSGILNMEEVAGEGPAWNTFIWFGGVVSLAGALTSGGLIPWFVGTLDGFFHSWQGLGPLLLLVVLYLYLHYGFASMTSQIIALYPAFLALALAAHAPPLLAALLFCFFSNLYASLTHYGDGAAPIYYGSGYIDQVSWWKVGFLLSLVNLAIWLGAGLPWWKLLGIW